MSKVYVAGVGMTKFIKPRDTYGYEELGLEASVKALVDAGMNYDDIDYAVAGYVYGDSTCGQRVVYQLGLTGIPVMNVNNNCSTGSTALFMANNIIKGGLADAVLCVGFEKMMPGSLAAKWDDRTNPLDKLTGRMMELEAPAAAPFACQFFANAGHEYIEKNHGSADSMARIAEINHRHSVNNPYSQFQDVYTLDQIKQSPKIFKEITKLQCCPTSDGAASVVVVSEKYLKAHPHLKNQAIEIASLQLMTDVSSALDGGLADLVGFGMSKKAVQTAYKEAGITADQVKIVELHDCFSANELITLDALGLSEPGKACELVDSGNITYGGKYVVNPSGGLISKGHPLGATGLAQCSELVWHLRGWATNRAVPDTRYALQHNLGLGGAVVIGIYKRPDGSAAPDKNHLPTDDGRSRLGYNPAIEARHLTYEQLRSAQSKKFEFDYMLEGNTLAPDAPEAPEKARL